MNGATFWTRSPGSGYSKLNGWDDRNEDGVEASNNGFDVEDSYEVSGQPAPVQKRVDVLRVWLNFLAPERATAMIKLPGRSGTKTVKRCDVNKTNCVDCIVTYIGPTFRSGMDESDLREEIRDWGVTSKVKGPGSVIIRLDDNLTDTDIRILRYVSEELKNKVAGFDFSNYAISTSQMHDLLSNPNIVTVGFGFSETCLQVFREYLLSAMSRVYLVGRSGPVYTIKNKTELTGSKRHLFAHHYAKNDAKFSAYNGNVVKGRPHGYGIEAQVVKKNPENIYDGEMYEDKRHGFGILKLKTGDEYRGQWNLGQRHGFGTFKFKNGGEYVGHWNLGKKHGFGIEISPDGTKYEGEWCQGQKHGQGTLTDRNGTKYVGQWYRGKRHGFGTCTYLDGSKYEGNFENGVWHGQGTATYPDGTKYVGQWNCGKQEGFGTNTFPDGSTYKGNFKDGLRHGHGIANFSNGSKYKGEWKSGVKHGRGVETDANGKVIRKGCWDNDIECDFVLPLVIPE